MSRRIVYNAYKYLNTSLHTRHFSNLRNYTFLRKNYNRCILISSKTSVKNLHTIESVTADDAGLFDWVDELDIDIRNVIKFDTSDPVIEALIASATVQQVFNILQLNRAALKKSHLVQSVLSLWHLQNVFIKVQTQMNAISDATEAEYVKKLHEEPVFIELLQNVEKYADEFDIDELTCSLLYLSKMSVSLRSPVQQKLVQKIEQKLKVEPAVATLAALSRTAVAFKHNAELWTQLYLLNLVPHIIAKLPEVQSVDQLRLLTICFLHCNQLLPYHALDTYRSLVKEFIDKSKLTVDDGKSIVKMMTFLSLTFWSNENTELIRQLARIIKGSLHKLNFKEVISIHKTFHIHQEPSTLAEEVYVTAKRYLDSGDLLPDKDLNVGMLSAVAAMAPYNDKLAIAKQLHRELESDYFINTMMNLFNILRSLKTSDRSLCHKFWSKTTDTLINNSVEREFLKLLRVAHRYMYFNNNMGGTYRHYKFERNVIAWILDEMNFGLSQVVPSRLARCTAFVVAYCQDPHTVKCTVDKLLAVRDQLSKTDCVALSRGVQIMLELAKKKPIHPDVMAKLIELDTCMNERAWQHLHEQTLTVTSVNSILRTFFNRRASSDSLLFHNIADKLATCNSSLNSRMIRDLSICVAGLGYLEPSLMDKMADYIVENAEDMMSETAERVLCTAYYFGYHPKCQDLFLPVCAQLLLREKERLSSLSILQTCLSLSYFHAFPPELVSYIFAVDFLERIDTELSTCYSKATYPVKVRYTLMELNRAVCLDQPELDVPWFHTKFCEEISALDPAITTVFHEDVKDQLIELIGDEDLIQTGVYSPYGYKINFLILLDDMTKPLLKSEESKAKVKLAVILHSDKQFTIGERRLKGQQQMRQRHLEMLGYRVVPIPQFVWNAMYLSDQHAKKMFLSDQIWPDR